MSDLRDTGRTYRMILRVLLKASAASNGRTYVVAGSGGARKELLSAAYRLAPHGTKCREGALHFPNGHTVMFYGPSFRFEGVESQNVFRDHYYDEVKSLEAA